MSHTLEEQQREIDNQRRQLELDQENFSRKVQWETERIRREQHLLEMKVRILEEELQKLAADKREFERQKAFYDRVSQYESQQVVHESNIVKGELFFIGVENKTSLKKRYKDLIKIYHPDNSDGDNDTVQEINNEYQRLRMVMDA
ncbi:MAG: molecular chaperone DnaJ [Lachnospiraceae bacterium]|nr:molecular chaperone DnaJ [Lachnospiraceae bacterium]